MKHKTPVIRWQQFSNSQTGCLFNPVEEVTDSVTPVYKHDRLEREKFLRDKWWQATEEDQEMLLSLYNPWLYCECKMLCISDLFWWAEMQFKDKFCVKKILRLFLCF